MRTWRSDGCTGTTIDPKSRGIFDWCLHQDYLCVNESNSEKEKEAEIVWFSAVSGELPYLMSCCMQLAAEKDRRHYLNWEQNRDNEC